MLDLLKEQLGSWGFSVLVNSDVYRECPALPKAYAEAGGDIVGHGRSNSEYQACRP